MGYIKWLIYIVGFSAQAQTFIIEKAIVVDYQDSTINTMSLPIILEISGDHISITSNSLNETFISQYRINKHNIVGRSSTGEIALLEIINKPLALRIRYSNKTYTFYGGPNK